MSKLQSKLTELENMIDRGRSVLEQIDAKIKDHKSGDEMLSLATTGLEDSLWRAENLLIDIGEIDTIMDELGNSISDSEDELKDTE